MKKLLTLQLLITIAIVHNAQGMFSKVSLPLKTFNQQAFHLNKLSSVKQSTRYEIQKRLLSSDIKNKLYKQNEDKVAQRIIKMMLEANRSAVEKNKNIIKIDDKTAKELEAYIKQLITTPKYGTIDHHLQKSKTTKEQAKEIAVGIGAGAGSLFLAPFAIVGAAMCLVGGAATVSGVLYFISSFGRC